MTFVESLNLVWPLVFLLIALFVLRKVEADLRPVFTSVVTGVAGNAQVNALRYAMAMMLASLSAMQALGDVAREMHWPYVEAFAKIATPALAAVVAFVQPSGPPTATKPPAP